MKTLHAIIALCALAPPLGVSIDLLMLNRHKGRIHDTLLRYWIHLDELSIPDIGRVFADYAIRFFKRFFGKRFFSFRCIVTITLVSFCLTLCALLVGLLLEYDNVGDILEDWPLWPWIFWLLVNLVFDTLTGLVTIKVLSVINHLKSAKAIFLIVMDIILAFFFACASYALCVTIPSSIIDEKSLNFVDFTDAAVYLLEMYSGSAVIHMSGFLYASTTFIPTFIYLTILATLIISKIILEIGIRTTKYFFEAATEVKESKDLKVFTLTGSLFSVIVGLLTAFTKLCQKPQ